MNKLDELVIAWLERASSKDSPLEFHQYLAIEEKELASLDDEVRQPVVRLNILAYQTLLKKEKT